LDVSPQDVVAVVPFLLGTGAGALGWWRLRHAGAPTWPGASDLQQAYRLHSIQAALHVRGITRVVHHLRARGVEPLLIKGWAAARLYPEAGLRPYGDIDVCVRPTQFREAGAALRNFQPFVDLHAGCRFLDDRDIDDLYAHSRLVRLGDLDVRVPCPEDHLRLLCLHFLGHGAWRPLWLCDIGAAVEALPSDFDWDRFLAGSRRRTEWALCALGLAQNLLDAGLEVRPAAERARRVPRWLVPAVLDQWGTTLRWPNRRPFVLAVLAHPAGALGELRRRWPDPVLASVHCHARFNDWPRLPLQLATFVARVSCVPRQIGWLLARHLRRRVVDPRVAAPSGRSVG